MMHSKRVVGPSEGLGSSVRWVERACVQKFRAAIALCPRLSQKRKNVGVDRDLFQPLVVGQ